MAKLQHKHAGLVLAAGASSRMGQPKALLPLPDGTPLAVHQARLLRDGGAADVVVVCGCDADRITPVFRNEEVRVVVNEDWAAGRLGSLQTGLCALPGDANGVLIMPVDTVGVKVDTLRTLLEAADSLSHQALRPVFEGEPGRLLWLHRERIPDLLAQTTREAFRLDAWIKPHETTLPSKDPAILHNLNTPEAWQTWREESAR
jgi:molybdenum cofactor cytidylyltransferase